MALQTNLFKSNAGAGVGGRLLAELLSGLLLLKISKNMVSCPAFCWWAPEYRL
jgi:hypothetical protein